MLVLTLRKFALQTAQSRAGPEGTTLRQGGEVKVQKGIRGTKGVEPRRRKRISVLSKNHRLHHVERFVVNWRHVRRCFSGKSIAQSLGWGRLPHCPFPFMDPPRSSVDSDCWSSIIDQYKNVFSVERWLEKTTKRHAGKPGASVSCNTQKKYCYDSCAEKWQQ